MLKHVTQSPILYEYQISRQNDVSFPEYGHYFQLYVDPHDLPDRYSCSNSRLDRSQQLTYSDFHSYWRPKFYLHPFKKAPSKTTSTSETRCMLAGSAMTPSQKELESSHSIEQTHAGHSIAFNSIEGARGDYVT